MHKRRFEEAVALLTKAAPGESANDKTGRLLSLGQAQQRAGNTAASNAAPTNKQRRSSNENLGKQRQILVQRRNCILVWASPTRVWAMQLRLWPKDKKAW